MITTVVWSRCVGLVGVALALSGCAKLNAAFADGDASDTDATLDPSSDSDSTPPPDPTPTSTGRPASTTAGDDTSDATTGYGTTGTSSGGYVETDAVASSGDESGATTGAALPPWTEACILEAASEAICLPTFSLDTMGTCGLTAYSPNFACDITPTTSFFLELPAGQYVLGAFNLSNPAFSTGTPTTDPFECAQGVVGFAPNEQDDVLIEVRDPMAGEVDFYVREVSTLCTVPPGCCSPSSNGVADACDDAALAGCVASVRKACETAYSPRCVEAAVLACGAFCPSLWD